MFCMQDRAIAATLFECVCHCDGFDYIVKISYSVEGNRWDENLLITLTEYPNQDRLTGELG